MAAARRKGAAMPRDRASASPFTTTASIHPLKTAERSVLSRSSAPVFTVGAPQREGGETRCQTSEISAGSRRDLLRRRPPHGHHGTAASRPPRHTFPGAPELRIPATMRSAVAIVALVAVAWPWLGSSLDREKARAAPSRA